MDEFSYEIISNALELYEDNILDSEERREMISIFIGYFCNLSCLGTENYDNLASNVTKYAYQLLKKQDQCVTIMKCTHAFFNPNYRDDQRIFECFKKCLKLADICFKQNPDHLSLYILILE